MRLLASIAVVPVLFVGWQLWTDHTLEQRLAPIASGVAGRSVTVDCQSLFGELLDAQSREGEVQFDASGAPRRTLFLTRKVCNRLRAFAASTHTPSSTACGPSPGGGPTRLPPRPSATHEPPARSRRSSSWPTRATTQQGHATRPRRTASPSRRWRGPRSSSEPHRTRPSSSHSQWRRSSRLRGRSMGRTTAIRASGSISIPRPQTSPPSIRSWHRAVPGFPHRSRLSG